MYLTTKNLERLPKSCELWVEGRENTEDLRWQEDAAAEGAAEPLHFIYSVSIRTHTPHPPL